MYHVDDARHHKLIDARDRAEAAWIDAINANGTGSPLNLPAREAYGKAEERLDAYRAKIDAANNERDGVWA